MAFFSSNWFANNHFAGDWLTPSEAASGLIEAALTGSSSLSAALSSVRVASPSFASGGSRRPFRDKLLPDFFFPQTFEAEEPVEVEIGFSNTTTVFFIPAQQFRCKTPAASPLRLPVYATSSASFAPTLLAFTPLLPPVASATPPFTSGCIAKAILLPLQRFSNKTTTSIPYRATSKGAYRFARARQTFKSSLSLSVVPSPSTLHASTSFDSVQDREDLLLLFPDLDFSEEAVALFD